MISQHILGEFHYFTVHGPEHLSWSLLSTEHFSVMLQIYGANPIHTLNSITLNNCVKDQAPLHSSVHPETTCTQLYPVRHCSHYKLFSSTVKLHSHLNLETGYPDRVFMGFLSLQTNFRRVCQIRPLMLLSQCFQFTVQ